MILEASTNYYEVLEVPPDATQQEIRQAYLRLKLAYSKDSVALYTLVSKDETDQILEKIEEAYVVLSSEEKRRDYDRNHSGVNETESPFGGSATRVSPELDDRIISIDRVPPMDRMSREEDLLVAPATDFSNAPVQNMGSSRVDVMPEARAERHSPAGSAGTRSGMGSASESADATSSSLASIVSAPEASTAPPVDRSIPPAAEPTIQEEIDRETEFPGHFIRRVRESQHISIEELSDHTKISKTYLLAIENEDFVKLPASTFVRGFVIQFAKKLRLPHDKVAAAYISRYRRACPDKS